jgi:hypothetical protein
MKKQSNDNISIQEANNVRSGKLYVIIDMILSTAIQK